ncbi:MAG: hypothetical protein AAFV09_06820, partial [Pseudomonadota bacterium]
MADGAPRLTAPTLTGGPREGLCTDCGVSRLGDGKACGRACQFIQPDYDAAERRVHGRGAVHRQMHAEERLVALPRDAPVYPTLRRIIVR